MKLIPPLQVSMRAAVAAGLSASVAHFFQLAHPLYAFISAIIVTDLSPAQTRKLGLVRIAGTIFGTLIGATLSVVLPPSSWVLGVGVFLSMFLTHVLGLSEAAKVAGYVCGIVMHDHGDSPWHYGLERFSETLLGIIVAMAVSVVPKLLSAEEHST